MSTMTITGNLTAAPELKFSGTGSGWITFTVAENRKDGERETTTFQRCKAFSGKGGAMAENIAESLDRGMRVIVSGRVATEEWESNGEKRSQNVLIVDSVGPDLRWATARVTRNGRVMSGSGVMQSVTPTPDPWGAPVPVEPPREEPW